MHMGNPEKDVTLGTKQTIRVVDANFDASRNLQSSILVDRRDVTLTAFEAESLSD
jgi:hypothetical protein